MAEHDRGRHIEVPSGIAMGWAAQTAGPVPDPATGVFTVRALHRLPSDVVGELMAVLAGDPRVVVCDLRGMAAATHSLVEVFAPVAPYLANWPAPLVVVCVERLDADAQMLPAVISHRLLVHENVSAGVEQAQALLMPVQHTMTYLSPVAEAASDGRAFASDTVRDWNLPLLVMPVGLVTSELVTHSLLHNRTVLALALSRCEDRVRVAVHDHGGVTPRLPAGELEQEIQSRGMLIVQALTRSWGVLPERHAGNTVWAVLDAA